jgi:hypothetical protein
MAKKQNVPSHAELALLAIKRASAGMRFIEENDISISEFRGWLKAVLDQLNEATYFLSKLQTSTSTTTFLDN